MNQIQFSWPWYQIFHFDSCWIRFKREPFQYNEPVLLFCLVSCLPLSPSCQQLRIYTGSAKQPEYFPLFPSDALFTYLLTGSSARGGKKNQFQHQGFKNAYNLVSFLSNPVLSLTKRLLQTWDRVTGLWLLLTLIYSVPESERTLWVSIWHFCIRFIKHLLPTYWIQTPELGHW